MKGNKMTNYTLKLINHDKHLDLREKVNEINSVVNHILSGGFDGNCFINIRSLVVNHVSKRSIELTVEENGNTHWHKSFGWNLANKQGMREFCNPSDDTEMFDW